MTLAVKQGNLLSGMGLLRTKVNMDCDTLGNKAANTRVNACLKRGVFLLECNAGMGIPLLK